jgi:hypothetical protein
MEVRMNVAEYDKNFWSLVDDEQIELFTKKETQQPQKKKTPKQSYRYKPDTYVGIEYEQREYVPIKEAPPTTEQVTQHLSSLTKTHRKSVFTQLGGGETPSEFRARKRAKKLARK